jgi:hypothetical protein
MKIRTRTSAIVLLILTTAFVLYISWGTSQPTMPPPSSAEQQKEVAALKQQIAMLEERVNWLVERQTAPQRQKPSQF